MSSQRILMTGGAGFIGTNLCNELRSRGHEVLAVDLLNNERDNYERCDVRSFRQLERVFDRHEFDCVYHLAAEYGRWNGEEYYENLWQTNVVGTKHMLRLQETVCIVNAPCVEEPTRRKLFPTHPEQNTTVQKSGLPLDKNNI